MINRKMNVKKRIAFAPGGSNRKSLIEWSYYNQSALRSHELIAPSAVASVLEGTIGSHVERLHDGTAAASQQLAHLITSQKIDVLIIFWDRDAQADPGIAYLQELAVANNIIIAANLATADFVLASRLMDKAHTVPVSLVHEPRVLNGVAPAQFAPRKAFLKVNGIN
jgi:methylglyoxal synthase